MKIIELAPPAADAPADIPASGPNGQRYLLQDVNALYSGIAESRRGRRYMFNAEPGEDIVSAFRKDEEFDDGTVFWKRVTAPSALRTAVREAVNRARH